MKSFVGIVPIFEFYNCFVLLFVFEAKVEVAWQALCINYQMEGVMGSCCK